MPESRAPVLRWTVGCGAELRERLVWQGEAVGDHVTSVDCTRLPDGTPIAVVGAADSWFQVWDLVTGAALGGPNTDLPCTWRRQPHRLVCTDLPDGTPVAVTLGQDGALRVWDLVAGRIRAATESGALLGWADLACTRLPDGTVVVVTGDRDGAIRFWDVATARPYGRPVTCEEARPHVACPAPVDGNSLLIIADRATLKVWDLGSGGFRGEPIETGFSLVASLACLRLADGTVLAVAGSDRERSEATGQRYGAVRAWDVSTGRPYGPPLIGHGDEISALACTQLPDGAPIAVSVNRFGTVQPWNLRSGLTQGPSLPHLSDLPSVACARQPDGTPVLVVTGAGKIQGWSLDVRPSPQGLTGPLWVVGEAGLPDRGEVLVTVGHEDREGYTVQLWDAGTGRSRGRMLAGAADCALGCLRTSEGAAVVTMTPDARRVQLWDLGSGTARDVVLAGHTEPVSVIACLDMHDGTPIVIIGGESVRAWRADRGRPYGPSLPLRLVSDRDMSCLQLPDGTLLVVAPGGETVRAWDAATGRPYGTPAAGRSIDSGVMDCVTLLDGSSAAVRVIRDPTRDDSVVRAWDLATGHSYGDGFHVRATASDAMACTRLPDGAVIAAIGGRQGWEQDHFVEIVDPIGGRKLYEFAVPDHVMDLRFTTEHRLVVRTYLDVAVYDLP